MPKTYKYEVNAVIYCKGESATAFYVLKSGRVCVSSDDRVDLDSNKNLLLDQIITPGGFFGAQAFLGGFSQRDTAVCISPSEVVAFILSEFDKMLEGNKDFVFHMLKVFAAKLFVVHDRLTRVLDANKGNSPSISPEDGFYNVANYLFSNRCYPQAVMAMNRYLEQYPQGKHIEICKRRIIDAQSKIGCSYDESYKLLFESHPDEVKLEKNQNEIEGVYEDALLMFEQEKYVQAIHKFSKILRKEDDPISKKYEPSCMYYVGISFLNLKKIQEAVDLFTQLINKCPQYDKIPETMFYLANCYEEQGNATKASALYKKSATILPEGSPLLESLKKKKGNDNFE